MFKNLKLDKENMIKLITVLIVATVVFLLISILTEGDDSHKEITSRSSTEETLCGILADIKGVGEVDAMIQYDEDSKVSGVIVTASGASNPVVKQNILKGVCTLFNISVSDVVVYEKN